LGPNPLVEGIGKSFFRMNADNSNTYFNEMLYCKLHSLEICRAHKILFCHEEHHSPFIQEGTTVTNTVGGVGSLLLGVIWSRASVNGQLYSPSQQQ